MKNYNLFLFDLDDTLLDFSASERLSFFITLEKLGIKDHADVLFSTYQVENRALWKLFEESRTTKDHLKVERFRKTFEMHSIDVDSKLASQLYLETLPETVVLIDHAVEVCEKLKNHGEIGIITNGIHHVQYQRIKKSKLAPYIDFVSVSEDCGFAKPDVRFFDYTVKMAKHFTKSETIIFGDRLEADILGAHQFGIDSCWFNPRKLSQTLMTPPTFEISHLSEILKIIFLK